MVNMRIAYQYHHLSNEAQDVAKNNNKGMLLSQFLYNIDGTNFESSSKVDCTNNPNPTVN